MRRGFLYLYIEGLFNFGPILFKGMSCIFESVYALTPSLFNWRTFAPAATRNLARCTSLFLTANIRRLSPSCNAMALVSKINFFDSPNFTFQTGSFSPSFGKTLTNFRSTSTLKPCSSHMLSGTSWKLSYLLFVLGLNQFAGSLLSTGKPGERN
jgi:hypothetical protein